jgi:MFS family permease
MPVHSHHHYFHFLKNRELNELYVTIGIRAFAISLVGIFIPIYLYQLGYSFQSIFIFYLFFSIFHALFSFFFAARIAARFGIKHSILFSMPIYLVFFFLLYTLEKFGWSLILISSFLAISTSLFWTAYHIDFSKFSKKKERGKQIGVSKIIAAFFGIIGPIIGGVILTVFGFNILFIVASIVLVSAVIPLFFSKEIHEPVTFSLKGFFRKQRISEIIGFMGHGIEAVIGFVLWPLFIFLFIFDQKYIFLGLVSSIGVFVSIIFFFIVGSFSDIYRRTIMRIGGIGNALVWIFKSFIITPIQVFIADAFYGATQATMSITFDALNYDKARERNIVSLVLQREVYHHFGRIVLLILMFFLVDNLVEVFRYGGSISSLMRFFF